MMKKVEMRMSVIIYVAAYVKRCKNFWFDVEFINAEIKSSDDGMKYRPCTPSMVEDCK